jgi:hypothetical protein
MKKFRKEHSGVFLVCFFLCSLQASTQETKWYKGNIHTHSLWSDGNDFPEMIVDWYKTHGYDFLSISDHNILANGEKWVKIPSHPFRQKRFREYLNKYGTDWVDYKEDTSGIHVQLKTLAEYRPLFEKKDSFLLIQAEEITDRYESKPVHLGAINVQELILPKGGKSVAEVMQNNLDAVYEQRRRTGEMMFAHINHPNFGWAIKVEDMMELKGDRFFEVYNGHPHVHNYGDTATIGMEELWDRLLIHYIKEGRELLYGLATDDAHDFIEFKASTSNPGRGWIMVRATELTPRALITAMEKGDFYATTGVALNELDFKNNKLNVKVKPEQGVEYIIQFWGANKSAKESKGSLLKEVKGTNASFDVRKDYLYVRAKIISTKQKENPYKEGDVETAWTQPVQSR